MRCPSCHAENDEHAETCFTCGQSLTAVIKRGSVIGSRYEILNPLGKGGMGVVYKAHDRVLEEEIAIKVLRSDVARSPEMGRRFRSEIRLARKVTHRNVCRIHEYGEDQGVRYISMELIEGVDLKQVIRERKGGLPPREAFEVSIQIAKGLQAIHDVGIIHRDLKTANIMRDGRGVVKLMDFGIAKQEGGGGGATATGDIVGTPEYMSPEQARGQKVDARSDLYAVAVVIHEIFSGDVPFRGDTPIVTIFKHIQDQPLLDGPGAPAFPAPLVPVLRRGLAKEVHDRFSSAEELVDTLRSARATAFPDVPSQPPGPRADAGAPGIQPAPAPGGTPSPLQVTPLPAPPAARIDTAAPSALPSPATVPEASPPTPTPVTPTPLPAHREVIDTAATHSIEPATASFGPAPAEESHEPLPMHAPPLHAPPLPAAMPSSAAPAPVAARTGETPPPPVQRPQPVRIPKTVPPPAVAHAEVRAARQQTQRIAAPAGVPALPSPISAEPPAAHGLLLPMLVIASLLLIMVAGVLLVGRILRPSTTPSAPPAEEPAASASRATPRATPRPRPSAAEEVITVPGATPRPSAATPVADAGITPAPAAAGTAPAPTTPASPSPAVAATPTATPHSTPAPTPPPSPRPAEPTPDQLRAQQLATLFGQADAAWSGQRYDEAGRHYDEILKLDAGNARAAAGKPRAVWAAAAIRRVFVLSTTVNTPMRTAKGPAGFDTADVDTKSQDFLCELGIEMQPPAIRPGGSYDYVAKVFLANAGKKAIKIKSMQANVTLDGALASRPLNPAVREVQKQRVAVAELAGSWKEEMKSWKLQVVLTGDKGDTCNNTVSWK